MQPNLCLQRPQFRLRAWLGLALILLGLNSTSFAWPGNDLNLLGVGTASATSLPSVASNQSGLAALQSQDASGLYTYYLPIVANDYKQQGTAGGYATYLAFQNFGPAIATVSLRYFDQLGNQIATPSDTCNTVSVNGECIALNPFPFGKIGTGIITSNQPLNVLMSEATPFGGSAYVVNSGASNSIIAPLALNHYLGFFSTQLFIYNGGAGATPVTVQYYNEDGRLVRTDTQSVAAHVSINFSQEDLLLSLPRGFNGWAQISGPAGSQLAVQLLEHRSDTGFVTVISGINQPQTTLYAPAIFNHGFGFTTGANIVNPSSAPVSVTVTYYRKDGQVINTDPFTLAAYSSQGIYHGLDAKQNGLPGEGKLDDFVGAAKVTSTGAGVAMVINEDGGFNDFGRRKSGTYTAISAGSTRIGLPAVANRGFGYITGVTVLNTSSTAVSGTIQYYNLNGSPEGGPRAFTVGPYSSLLQYQGDPTVGLPDGSIPGHEPFYGTAIITESSNGTAGLIATVNALSDDFFYTYAEPAQ